MPPSQATVTNVIPPARDDVETSVIPRSPDAETIVIPPVPDAEPIVIPPAPDAETNVIPRSQGAVAGGAEDETARQLREAYDDMIARDGKPLTDGAAGGAGGGKGGKKGGSAPGKRKRWPWIVFPIVAVVLILGVFGVVFIQQALEVRDTLTTAKEKVAQVLPLVKEGDTEGVQKIADEILALTSEADATVSNDLWKFAGAIPLIGQNVSAVGETTKATHILVRDALPSALELLAIIDVKTITVAGGGINLQPFRDAQPHIPALRAAFEEAQGHIDTIDRDAILPFVDDNIGQLIDIVDQAAPGLAMAEKYLPNIINMLGGEGARTYALLFQTNAEMRATGGNPGGAAILTINDGQVEMREDWDVARFIEAGRSGRYYQEYADPANAELFEEDTPKQSQNFTRTPDFRDTASMVDGLWNDATGGNLDGVIALDPIILSYMLAAAGPVDVPGEKQQITADNAAEILMSSTYERFGVDGAAADIYFAKVTAAVFTKIMSGGWDPLAMWTQLQKGIDEQRLYMWFANEAEQAMSVEFGLNGEVTTNNDKTTQVGVYLNNTSYSKLDYYLSTSINVSCSSADRTITTSITMNNAVPRNDLSEYTLAWRNGSLGFPRTTMLFDVISLGLPGGQLVETTEGDLSGWDRTGTYNGREAHSTFVAIPKGESRTVSSTSTIPQTDLGAPLSVRYSPTVTQTPVTIEDSCLAIFPPAE